MGSLNLEMAKNRTDLHKVYYDDESHNKGHGHVYEHLGIDPGKGCIVIVRPDQRGSWMLLGMKADAYLS